MAFSQFNGSEEYVVSKELTDAVNIAMALKKPLLIKRRARYRKNNACPGQYQTHSAWILLSGISSLLLRLKMASMFMTLFKDFMTASLAAKM